MQCLHFQLMLDCQAYDAPYSSCRYVILNLDPTPPHPKYVRTPPEPKQQPNAKVSPFEYLVLPPFEIINNRNSRSSVEVEGLILLVQLKSVIITDSNIYTTAAFAII